MMISASTSSRSKVEFSPSLSEVVTRVWPWSSSHLRMPSSFSVVPRRPGTWEVGVACQCRVLSSIDSLMVSLFNSSPPSQDGSCLEPSPMDGHVIHDCAPDCPAPPFPSLPRAGIRRQAGMTSGGDIPTSPRAPRATPDQSRASRRGRRDAGYPASHTNRLGRQKKKSERGECGREHLLTCSAWTPPSYRTARTLTFSRGTAVVSRRVERRGPNLGARNVGAGGWRRAWRV